MLKATVTIGCVAGMVLAGWCTIRWRHTCRTPTPLTGQEPFGERLAVTVARTGGMLLGAELAGILTIGAGVRFMMRVIAVTSPADVQGLRTEADATIGVVTTDGSLFLVVTTGIGVALLGLALFTSLRRWLPDRSVVAGLVGVAIGAGMLVRRVGLLTASNRDFQIVAPRALAVALALAVLALLGATFGVLVDRFGPRWPRPGRSVRGVGSLLPFAVLLAAPPLFALTMIGVLTGTVLPRLRHGDALARGADRGADARSGRTAVLALGGLGTVSIAVAAGQILVA